MGCVVDKLNVGTFLLGELRFSPVSNHFINASFRLSARRGEYVQLWPQDEETQ